MTDYAEYVNDDVAEHDRFERLKDETLDLLGGIGGTWMSFDDIASEHEACDGEVDRDALQVALTELIDEGRIEWMMVRGGVDEYRWRDPEVGESESAKVRRLEQESVRLQDEAAGMRRELQEQAERVEQLERENEELRDCVRKALESVDRIRVQLVKALRQPVSVADTVRRLVSVLEEARLP